MESYDKFIGGLFGVAIGDALGAPFEFIRATPKIPYTGILSDVSVSVQFKFHKMIIQPSSITDDTEMTIQLLKSILFENKYDTDKVIKNYLLWVNMKGTPLGKNTRNLMKGVTTINGFRKRQLKIDTKDVESNGSLMRCFPIALLDNWRIISDIDVSLTNDNDVNRECSLIYLGLIRHIIFGEKLKLKCSQKSIKKAIKNALNNVIIDVSIQKGWVVHALYVCLITFFNCDSFQNGMNFIAKHFIKGDTDTIMAITGGILGSYFGFES